MQPPLIFADEPTGSLDSDSAKHLMEIFSNLNKQGQTIIMVTHNMDLCKWCSRNIKIVGYYSQFFKGRIKGTAGGNQPQAVQSS